MILIITNIPLFHTFLIRNKRKLSNIWEMIPFMLLNSSIHLIMKYINKNSIFISIVMRINTYFKIISFSAKIWCFYLILLVSYFHSFKRICLHILMNNLIKWLISNYCSIRWLMRFNRFILLDSYMETLNLRIFVLKTILSILLTLVIHLKYLIYWIIINLSELHYIHLLIHFNV